MEVITMTTTTNNNNTANQHNILDQLAHKAAAGTLKRIYTASANNNICRLQSDLQHDFSIIDNNLTGNLSDAYDLYTVAYSFLLEQYNNGLTEQSEITTTLKNGKEKTRTVYQWACVAVRKAVYAEKSIESNGKYIYIEDLTTSNTDTSENALDREYIRLGKYNDLGSDSPYGISAGSSDYTAYIKLVQSLNLTHRQSTIIKMRMQGLSVTTIADKLGVSHPAISKSLLQVQGYIDELYPDMVKRFKHNRNR